MLITMAASSPKLETDPSSELEFFLNASRSTPKVDLTLRHAGGDGPLAFKVKTTQPRRYLVRPNQGLIAPGGSEVVQILLVEKDKQALMESYAKLGQAALENCKDKFLVQSCAVGADFETSYRSACESDAAKGYDKLTSMWTGVVTSNQSTPVANMKLHVRHIAQGEATSAAPSSSPMPTKQEPSKPIENMNTDELRVEMGNLRRKYDELVSFSVNLTAERDILNNTLEQTKRELNREVNKSAAQRNANMGGNMRGGKVKAGGYSTFMLVLIAVIMFALGVRMEARGLANLLKRLPIMNMLLGNVNGNDEL